MDFFFEIDMLSFFKTIVSVACKAVEHSETLSEPFIYDKRRFNHRSNWFSATSHIKQGKNHFDNLMIHSRKNIRFFSLASH